MRFRKISFKVNYQLFALVIFFLVVKKSYGQEIPIFKWAMQTVKGAGDDYGNADTTDAAGNVHSIFDFGPNAGGRIEYLLNSGTLSLNFRYELGLLDLQKQAHDNTKNSNRAFLVGISYLKMIRN
jgi:hypothetical protein